MVKRNQWHDWELDPLEAEYAVPEHRCTAIFLATTAGGKLRRIGPDALHFRFPDRKRRDLVWRAAVERGIPYALPRTTDIVLLIPRTEDECCLAAEEEIRGS